MGILHEEHFCKDRIHHCHPAVSLFLFPSTDGATLTGPDNTTATEFKT